MIDCRAMQDRASDLLLLVNKNHAGIRISVRNTKAQVNLLEGVAGQEDALAEARANLRIYEAQDDELRFLGEVVRSKQSNLKMTSSDIRLLCSVVEQQIRLGGGDRTSRRGSSVAATPNNAATNPVEPDAPRTAIQETVPQPNLESSQPAQRIDPGGESPVLSIDEFLGGVSS